MKNREIIEKIIKYHPALPDYSGCDTYKSGSPEEECKGIAVALVPSAEVIEKAHRCGCNLLITHEPIFYQTPDYSEWRGSFQNTVYEEKQKLLEEYHMTVWRDHDHMHAHKPDSIFSGVIKQLGWKEHQIEGKIKLPLTYRVELPKPTTVRKLSMYLANRIGLKGTRYIGKDDDEVKRILIAAHLYPNAFYMDGVGHDGFYHDYCMDLMHVMETEKMDALIPGEIVEWTILSYIRDASFLGRGKSCFPIGHFSLEELGMKEATNWIQQLAGTSLKVIYIPTGEAYSYLVP
ncbi:NIF3 (NGG1p interacting factor 3) [Clostridium sp. C105KSO13]|nr:NIF3 (NGG1p interacting factor 3) [Clostridium sp. C105KSO13]